MGCVGKTVRAAASTLFVKPPCALDDSFKIGEAGYVLLSPSPKLVGPVPQTQESFFFFFFLERMGIEEEVSPALSSGHFLPL